jgi:hypothetical protein
MTTLYTYSEAKRNFSTILDKVIEEGEVRIKRQDGQIFIIQIAPKQSSPLDVEGVSLDITADEIVGFIKEGRRYD